MRNTLVSILRIMKDRTLDETWHSAIESCEVVSDGTTIPWSDKADIVIIGLGAAGVSCALQALELKQSVIALDRFDGGGATVASGGVIYAGGGTPPQIQAGISDSPENMYNYLKMEIGEIVSDATLTEFCEQSAPTIS